MDKKSQAYIWLKRSALNKGTHEKEYWVGRRVFELIKLLEVEDKEDLMKRVRINEQPLKARHLIKKLKPGDRVDIMTNPQGGVGDFVLDIAFIIIGIALVIGTGNPLFLTEAGKALIISGSLSLVSKVLSRSPGQAGAVGAEGEARKRAQITGASNQVSKGIIPFLFGTTQFTPFYGQNYSRWTGDGDAINVLNQYFVSTYNNVNVYNQKLGETKIQDFEGNISSTISHGESESLAFENIFTTGKDEQLTIEEGTLTNDIATSLLPFSGPVAFTLDLTYTPLNDINNFTDKVIQISGDASGESTSITVTSADLVDNVTHYSYTSPTINLNLTNDKIVIQNSNITQQSNDEINEDLRGTLDVAFIDVTDFNFDRLEGQSSFIVDTSPDGTIGLEWVFVFGQGLFRSTNGVRTGRAINARCRYKLKDALAYSDLDNAARIYVRNSKGEKMYLDKPTGTIYASQLTSTTYNQADNQITFYSPSDATVIDELFFRNIGIEIPKGQYTYNVSSKGFVGGKTNEDIGTTVLADINSIIDGPAVNPAILPDLTQIRITAKAYRNLTGNLSKYNFIGKSVMPIWNGIDWGTEEETTNPASVIRYIITSPLVNPRADSIELLDNDSFTEFYEYCEAEGFGASGIVTEQKKILSIIETILSNCQSILTDVDGKIGIAIDRQKEVSGMVTPHNSWGQSVSYSIGRKTDALRVTYIDSADYKEKEVTRYFYDGDTHDTPALYKTTDDYFLIKQSMEYITDLAHVEKLIKYTLKTTQERVREFTFKVNLEGLGFSIYDRVQVSNTTKMGREFSGRIQYVTRDLNGDITKLKLKSYIKLGAPENGSHFKIYIRSMRDLGNEEGDFAVQSFDITENDGRFIELTPTVPFDDLGIVKGLTPMVLIEAESWYDGDIFDVNDSNIHDCVITDVKPEQDLTATVKALETNPEFWEA